MLENKALCMFQGIIVLQQDLNVMCISIYHANDKSRCVRGRMTDGLNEPCIKKTDSSFVPVPSMRLRLWSQSLPASTTIPVVCSASTRRVCLLVMTSQKTADGCQSLSPAELASTPVSGSSSSSLPGSMGLTPACTCKKRLFEDLISSAFALDF